MADFEKAVQLILKHEGGFVDHPDDPGGATNLGITFNLFKQYAVALGLGKTVHALENLTQDQAKFIYRENFWKPMQGDNFENQQIAEIVFDAYVNMGGKALKMFQMALGVKPDGDIGPYTLAILHQQAPAIVFENFKDYRIDFYKRLVVNKPQLKVFEKGWMNRINSFTYDT